MFQGPKNYIAQICTKCTCSTETVQQNGRFTRFSSKFHSNIYSILFGSNPLCLVLRARLVQVVVLKTQIKSKIGN